MIFDPKVHICKFGFELYDYAMISPYKYKILGDMYNNELQILFFDKRYGKQVDAVGFKLSPQRVNELLPLIIWEDYEEMRDLPEDWFWDFENGVNGYRDGWSYLFWCTSECGAPLLQIWMTTTFKGDMLPPHEKLLKWLRIQYSKRKQLADKDMAW